MRLGVLDRDPERGDMVRRGADLDFEGVGDLANAEVCWRDRVRPRLGETEGMGSGLYSGGKFRTLCLAHVEVMEALESSEEKTCKTKLRHWLGM